MSTLSQNIKCPVCSGALVPRVLECRTCDLKVEGRFGGTEFAALSTDDLHFLRIFIHCEGRIRDMEAALGVSYPTVKARLASLKEALSLAGDTVPAEPPTPAATAAPVAAPTAGATANRGRKAGKKTATADPSVIIAALEKGEIDYDEAMKQLKDVGGGGKADGIPE